VKHKALISLTTLCCLGAITTPAYAYLDPGMGALSLQILLAALAGGIATVATGFRKVWPWSAKDPSKDKQPKE
jgi:hypothetical protein